MVMAVVKNAPKLNERTEYVPVYLLYDKNIMIKSNRVSRMRYYYILLKRTQKYAYYYPIQDTIERYNDRVAVSNV